MFLIKTATCACCFCLEYYVGYYYAQPKSNLSLIVFDVKVSWSTSISKLLPCQAVQQQLSKREIEDLLKRGAYGAIMDEEDEGAKFCEEDIDQILQRRTKTITIESEGRGSTFAKVNEKDAGNRLGLFH